MSATAEQPARRPLRVGHKGAAHIEQGNTIASFDAALAHLQPHRLCVYLFDLAQRLTAFYDACPVLSSEGALREQRLALCDLAARTLSIGLSVLGIDAPEKM